MEMVQRWRKRSEVNPSEIVPCFCYIPGQPLYMQRLNSWKEIAKHLGVTVRTAQKWERDRGLPVERLPGSRGPVSISLSDLEKWRQSAAAKAPLVESQNGNGAEVQGHLPLAKAFRRTTAWLVVVLALSVTLYAVLTSSGTSAQPASYRVGGRTLSVFDSAGRLLWDHTFADPIHEGIYQHLPLTWFGDLDGDGTTEFLFVYQKSVQGAAGASLYCFSHDGKILWQFVPGRSVRTAKETFDPSFFSTRGILVTKDSNRGTVIVANSIHALYYPSQIAVLSPRGQLLAEYWHSGHIDMVKALDLDRDGRKELYLSGINNELHAATLIVLELEGMSGTSGSRHNADYQILNVPMATERTRLVFNRSCINLLLETFNRVSEAAVGAETLTVSVQEDFAIGRSWEYHVRVRPFLEASFRRADRFVRDLP
jgi:hypothetical protein